MNAIGFFFLSSTCFLKVITKFPSKASDLQTSSDMGEAVSTKTGQLCPPPTATVSVAPGTRSELTETRKRQHSGTGQERITCTFLELRLEPFLKANGVNVRKEKPGTAVKREGMLEGNSRMVPHTQHKDAQDIFPKLKNQEGPTLLSISVLSFTSMTTQKSMPTPQSLGCHIPTIAATADSCNHRGSTLLNARTIKPSAVVKLQRDL